MESRLKYVDPQIVEVELSELFPAESPRADGEDPEHVQSLLAAGGRLPPIIVHRSTMRVVDGLHRLRAAALRGQRTIQVCFFDGDQADAFVVAVESNIAHGRPLSMADRKRAAGLILHSHPHWSDRKIASVTGIAPGTVAELRKQSPDEACPVKTRMGRDGRIRPINSAERRRLAGEIITENPELSLRQIARAAGISPETARDVRNRLSRGEDPLPEPRGAQRMPCGQRDYDDGPAPRVRTQIPDRGAVMSRLRVDPALRFSEKGRNLLWLLSLHTISEDQWAEIESSVPPHVTGIIALMAAECAEMWAEFATRLDRRVVRAG